MSNGQALADALIAGNRRALARAITLVETGGPAVAALMHAIYPHTGHARVVGITGPPGAGKSTMVNALAQHWRRAGSSVGIIAIDPTSPFTGGAILGDRIRMQPLGGDTGVFVRSMASRGRLGGIARATDDAVVLLDAAGFAVVLVETVGAGQSEVAIAGTVQTTIVVETPGNGDDVQSIKAGILEIADIYVVNKADRVGADALMQQLRVMLGLAERPRDTWEPPVLPVVATHGDGIAALVDAIVRHAVHGQGEPARRERETARAARVLAALVQEQALARAQQRQGAAGWSAAVAQIVAREADPHTLAAALVDALAVAVPSVYQD